MSSTTPKLALSEPAATAALFALALTCAGLLFVLERAVPPIELPSLSLPRAPVEAVIRADATAASAAPKSKQAVALEALLWRQGAAEAPGIEDLDTYRNRRKALELGYRALVRVEGEARVLRLRSKAVAQLEAALDLQLKDEQAKAVLGSFTAVLEHEGASRNGYLVAPRFVVRTLYKARWNILHGLAPDYTFERVEKRAFYGWQALHAERVPLQRRIEALHAYGLAGGDQIEEALGVLLFRMGDYRQAAKALRAAQRKHGSLRLRNYVLGALSAAGHTD
jgi:hypothetical protein